MLSLKGCVYVWTHNLNPTDIKMWRKGCVSHGGCGTKDLATNWIIKLLTTIPGTVQDTGQYLPKALFTQWT